MLARCQPAGNSCGIGGPGGLDAGTTARWPGDSAIVASVLLSRSRSFARAVDDRPVSVIASGLLTGCWGPGVGVKDAPVARSPAAAGVLAAAADRKVGSSHPVVVVVTGSLGEDALPFSFRWVAWTGLAGGGPGLSSGDRAGRRLPSRGVPPTVPAVGERSSGDAAKPTIPPICDLGGPRLGPAAGPAAPGTFLERRGRLSLPRLWPDPTAFRGDFRVDTIRRSFRGGRR